MAEIITPRQKIRNESYSLVLDPIDDNKPSYAFDCDKNGKVDLESLPPNAQDNYARHIDDPEYEKIVTKYSSSYIANAVALCECGKEIELYDEYLGASECPYCGQWHNMFGQMVTDPMCWSRGEDW